MCEPLLFHSIPSFPAGESLSAVCAVCGESLSGCEDEKAIDSRLWSVEEMKPIRPRRFSLFIRKSLDPSPIFLHRFLPSRNRFLPMHPTVLPSHRAAAFLLFIRRSWDHGASLPRFGTAWSRCSEFDRRTKGMTSVTPRLPRQCPGSVPQGTVPGSWDLPSGLFKP